MCIFIHKMDFDCVSCAYCARHHKPITHRFFPNFSECLAETEFNDRYIATTCIIKTPSLTLT